MMVLEPPFVSPALVLPSGEEFGGPLTRPVLQPGQPARAVVVLATLRAWAVDPASLPAPSGVMPLISAGWVSPVLTFSRAAPAGSRATYEGAATPLVLIAAGSLSPSLAFSRAQSGGSRSTHEVAAPPG